VRKILCVILKASDISVINTPFVYSLVELVSLFYASSLRLGPSRRAPVVQLAHACLPGWPGGRAGRAAGRRFWATRLRPGSPLRLFLATSPGTNGAVLACHSLSFPPQQLCEGRGPALATWPGLRLRVDLTLLRLPWCGLTRSPRPHACFGAAPALPAVSRPVSFPPRYADLRPSSTGVFRFPASFPFATIWLAGFSPWYVV
jgi:hypothetical protein